MKIRTRRSREQWLELVHQWKESNTTAIAWCREHGISYESFIIWKNRLNTDARLTDKPFIELVDVTPISSGIEIHHRNLKFIVRKNFDPESLLQCLQVLEKI